MNLDKFLKVFPKNAIEMVRSFEQDTLSAKCCWSGNSVDSKLKAPRQRGLYLI